MSDASFSDRLNHVIEAASDAATMDRIKALVHASYRVGGGLEPDVFSRVRVELGLGEPARQEALNTVVAWVALHGSGDATRAVTENRFLPAFYHALMDAKETEGGRDCRGGVERGP